MGRAALHDVEMQEALKQAAFEDVLFFFAFAGWVFEPRSQFPVKPFVPWTHQVPVILEMDAAIDEALASELPMDVLLDKSRAQGGTYIYLNLIIRRWLRDSMFSAGLVTRNERLVDSATDSDTLLWKVNWALERLPVWMLPEGFDFSRHRSLSDHSFLNPEKGGTIVGYSAGQDVGRGGRKSVFVCDEIGALDFVKGGKDRAVMDSLHDVTNVIFLVSTFGCDSGVFWEAANAPDSTGKHLVLDWRDNPVQSRLAFRVEEGQARAVRPSEQAEVDGWMAVNGEKIKALERRGYSIGDKTLSPWYIMRCLRKGATPRLIAKELDRNPRGAVGKVFDTEVLDRMRRECCRPPIWQGKAVFDQETLELKGLIRQEHGSLKLWFRPGGDNAVPRSRYGIGCDISAGGSGNYSSNSAACGVDMATGEQVLEWAAKGWPATKFARMVVGLSKWLHNAYLGWEASGPTGTEFGKVVVEKCDYQNVYYRDVDEIGSRRKTRKLGWYNGSDEDKGELFEELGLAFEGGAFVSRSLDLIRECGEYEWEGGKIIHRPTKSAGELEKAHGDRCLIEGTMILTDCGEKPIEDLIPGDMVWTRDGLRPVQICGKTGFEPVLRLTLSNGRTLTGTGNHPVWTENNSWVELQSLCVYDRLLAWTQKQFAEECTSAVRPRRRSFSTAGDTTATRALSRSIGGDIFGAGEATATARKLRCTLPSGSITTGLFRAGSLFITRMATFLTTISRILSASAIQSTGRFIETAGICGSTAIRSCTTTSARIAEKSIRHSANTARSSVVRRVVTDIVGKIGSITKRGCALFAAQSFARTSTTKPRRARRNAEAVYVQKIERLGTPQRVYNLSVDETPEYFAQGVLVHNCIAGGVAYLLCRDRPIIGLDRGTEDRQDVEYGSFGWRQRREEEDRRQWSDDRPQATIEDVLRVG
jgi:hypothetical protein